METEGTVTGTSKTKAVVKQAIPFPEFLQRIRALAEVLESEKDDKRPTHIRMYSLHEYIIMNKDTLTTACMTEDCIEAAATETDLNNGSRS